MHSELDKARGANLQVYKVVNIFLLNVRLTNSWCKLENFCKYSSEVHFVRKCLFMH